MLGASVVVGSSYYAYKEVDAPSSSDSEEEIIVTDSQDGSVKRIPVRKPASQSHGDSIARKSGKSAAPVIEEKNESNFVNADNPSDYMVPAEPEKEKENYSFFGGGSSAGFGNPVATGYSGGSYSGSSGGSGGSGGGSGSRSPSSSSSGGGDGSGGTLIIGGGGLPTILADDHPKAPEVNNGGGGGGGGGGGSSEPETNACTPSVLSGSFGNPFGVTITCTQASNIKYCLGKGGCCDPNTTGTNYTTAIVIGKTSGDYCLTFYGDSTDSSIEDSEVTQHNYTVNSSLPNLTVGAAKTHYQTTELEGTSFMTSTDFGKPNYFIGQMNFKSNNPGATDCQELVEGDYSGFSPMPSTMLSIFDVSVITASSQVQIPFKADKVDYGLNYFVSYVKNNSYVSPLYSCATNSITLEDFDYFEIGDAQSSAGFEGQFTSYGFFEADADVYRGPAGVASEDQSGTVLESGLMSIFY